MTNMLEDLVKLLKPLDDITSYLSKSKSQSMKCAWKKLQNKWFHRFLHF